MCVRFYGKRVCYCPKEAGFARGCHGDLVTVPDSAIARWIRRAEKVVLIDGCFFSCHGRMLEVLLKKDRLVQFDAVKVYRKYTDVFDIDEVPEEERSEAARQVANRVLAKLGSRRPGRTIEKMRSDECHSN